jgi:L-ribulose-5-phosphate 3-epimerase UlaE
VEAVAPYARNIHVKDFAFSRRDGWVGFTFAGCPLGEGLLDYRHLITTTRARERGLSEIIEHWLPLAGGQRQHHPHRKRLEPPQS